MRCWLKSSCRYWKQHRTPRDVYPKNTQAWQSTRRSKKAQIDMELLGADVGLANEGAFVADPYAVFY